MGGSSNQPPPTQTTTFQMSPEQRSIYNLALPGIQSYAATVPQRYQGEQVAGFTDPQTQGQQAILAAAPTIGQQGTQAAGTNSYWLSPDAINVAAEKR